MGTRRLVDTHHMPIPGCTESKLSAKVYIAPATIPRNDSSANLREYSLVPR